MIVNCIRILAYAYKSENISVEMKHWTLETDIFDLCEHLLEYDVERVKDGKKSQNISMFTYFLIS